MATFITSVLWYNMLFKIIIILMTAALVSSQSCTILSHNLSPDDINILVNEHNRLRAKVANGQQPDQPSASNMRQLSWDNQLALAAQEWADECKFQHNQPTHSQFSWVGQNLFIQYGGTKLDLTRAVQRWFNEVVTPGFSSQNISPFKYVRGAGHYTQVVWANTYKLGCGLTTFQKGSPTRNIYLVCNYGPGGNVIGTNMYEPGPSCTKCPNGCSTQAGLCN